MTHLGLSPFLTGQLAVEELNRDKLVREEARKTTSLARQRHRERQFGKLIRQHTDFKRDLGRKH